MIVLMIIYESPDDQQTSILVLILSLTQGLQVRLQHQEAVEFID